MKRFIMGSFLCLTLISVLFLNAGTPAKANVSDDVLTASTMVSKAAVSANQFGVGDTFVTPEFRITIDSVAETSERDPYADIEPAAVYIVTYTYENLSYRGKDESGLLIDLTSYRINDVRGNLGYDYSLPRDKAMIPAAIRPGMKQTAQVMIGTDYKGPFTINFKMYDTKKENLYNAFFSCD